MNLVTSGDPDPPPPHKNDVLFGPSNDDIAANACLHFVDSPDVLYSWGYLNAARKPRDHVLEYNVDLDTFIFPIIYLYRQHVELVMKGLVVKGVEIVGRDLSDAEERHLGDHNLKNLWEDLQPIMGDVFNQAHWKMPDREHIQGMNSYIRQLTEHPPDAFRFPASKRGEPYLTTLTHINVRTFSDCMEKFSNFLDGLDAAFRGYADLKETVATEQQEQGEMG